MDPTATNVASRTQQRLGVALNATPPSSDDADDRADVLCYLDECLATMIMKSKMMPNLSSMADEVARVEVQRLDVEMVANEDLHKLSYEQRAPTSESGCWIDRQLTSQPSDGNVTSDSRRVELKGKTKLQ